MRRRMGTEAGIVAAVARTSQGHHHAVVDAVGRRRWSKMEDGADYKGMIRRWKVFKVFISKCETPVTCQLKTASIMSRAWIYNLGWSFLASQVPSDTPVSTPGG